MRPRSGLARDEGAFFKVGVLWVLPTPLERQGTLACPAGAPFLGKKWGKEPPGEEVPPPGPPSLVGAWGKGCTSYRIPGLRPLFVTLVTARPPAGRAGDVGRYLWEKAESNRLVSRFLLPSTNHFSRPPEPVGGP